MTLRLVTIHTVDKLVMKSLFESIEYDHDESSDHEYYNINEIQQRPRLKREKRPFETLNIKLILVLMKAQRRMNLMMMTCTPPSLSSRVEPTQLAFVILGASMAALALMILVRHFVDFIFFFFLISPCLFHI